MSQATANTTINGVDLNRLGGTIETIKEQPSIAKFTFRAKNRWIDGGHGETEIQGFYGAGQEDTSRTTPFVLHADEPDVLLGTDHAPNATEVVLHALASCLNTTLVYHAAALGVSIDELSFDLEGDLDLHGFLGLSDEVRNGYEGIRVNIRIKSDAPAEKIQELTHIAQQRSPVFDIVTNPTPVKVSVDIN